MRRGTVTAFDDAAGLGTVVDDAGAPYLFHVIEIADGTRTIEPGREVVFRPLPRFGVLQAGRLLKL